MADVLTFESFHPGALMGTATETVDERMLELWNKLYPWDETPSDQLPLAMATVLMMRAYMQVLVPRPPGNVHARQHFELLAPIDAGERVTTEVRCVGKEVRRGRRHIELATRSTGSNGRVLFNGRMGLIWAA